MTFTAPNRTPRNPATLATAAASISTTTAPYFAPKTRFRSTEAISATETSPPDPAPVSTRLPSPASITVAGMTTSPTPKSGVSAPANPAEITISGPYDAQTASHARLAAPGPIPPQTTTAESLSKN